MPEPSFTPEDIIDLAEQLRRARFNIGLQQYVAAENLMIALLTQGRLPEDPRKWKSLLGPIFCSNPLEQEQFPQLFDSWISRKPNLVKQVEEAKQGELAEALPSAETVLPEEPLTIADALNWIRRHPAWSMSAALLLAAVVTAVLMVKLDRRLEGQVFSQSNSKELPGAEVSFLGQTVTTDAEGRFSIGYQIRVYEWIASTRVEQFAVAHTRHYQETALALLKDPPKPSITLQVRPEDLPRIEDPNPIPPPGTQTEQKETPPVERPNYWRPVLAALIPLLAVALFLLVRWIRRRMMLRKLETSGTPQLHKVTFKREDAPMFVSLPFRRAAQELRRHRQTSHHDLDVTATVNATIQKGVFTPAYSARRAAPEYLLLVDRASVHDSQARLADELARRLDADKVYVDQFYFQEDARTLREPKPLSPVITLHELASRYPDHRLLVFSDAEGFFNPFTGEPGDWLEQFDYWERRILLTPESPAAWGYREFTLAEEYGFTLIPAKTEGLAALANLLNFDLSPGHDADNAPTFPELIARDSERWLDSREPKPEVIERLCRQLKNYLGEDGWLWLAACAVYPQIKWEITLYLGGRLAQRYGTGRGVQQAASLSELSHKANRLPAETSTSWKLVEHTSDWNTAGGDWAERVLRLVRLPWFRFGRMPDWMRDRLIADFTAEQDRSIRRIVTDLLSRVTKDITQPLTLDFAEPEPPKEKWKAFKHLLSERYQQWRQHRQFYRLFQTQDADNPLRDFVFLSFLAGHSRKRLGVKPPDLLRRILFNEGAAALGVRAATASLAAVAMAGMLMFVLWPKPPQLPKKEKLLATNSPTPSATPAETVTLTPLTSPTPKPTPAARQTPTPTGASRDEAVVELGGERIKTPTPTGASLNRDPFFRDPLSAPTQTGVQGQTAFTVKQTAEGYSVNLGEGVRPLELVSRPGGVFTMGWEGGWIDAKPLHQARLSPFSIGKYEVTQEQWLAVMGNNDSYFKGDSNLPKDRISWEDAVKFCKQLSAKTDYTFRLPTEAEWEYACRAGTNTRYSFGDDEKQLGQFAWYSDNSGGKTQPVGGKKANAFGLYDMHGNVSEWCSDWYDENYYAELSKQGMAVNPQGPAKGYSRVMRGGSWRTSLDHSSGNRGQVAPHVITFEFGFRIVLVARTQ